MKCVKWIVLAVCAAVFNARAEEVVLTASAAAGTMTMPAANPFAFERGAFDTGLPMTITSERSEFANKEKVAIFDGQVKVTHPQFNLEAEQVFVFLNDANELKNILAQGVVVMTNDSIRAMCDWALYTRAEGTLVMRATVEGSTAKLLRGTVDSWLGTQITLWLEDGRIEVINSQLTFTMGTGGATKETPEPEEEKTVEPEKPKPSLYTDPEAQAE